MQAERKKTQEIIEDRRAPDRRDAPDAVGPRAAC